MTTAQPAEVGAGALARAAAVIYRLLVLQTLFGIAAAPGLALLVLLAPDSSNAPLAALALLPVGPALAAVVFGWRHSAAGLDDLRPARHFWRGYRLNAVPVLRWWAPALAIAAVIGFNLAHLELVVAGPARLVITVATVAVVGLLAVVCVFGLVITSLFTLRTRDVVLLALAALHRPRSVIGVVVLLVVALGLVLISSEWVLALLAVPFVVFGLHLCTPIIRDLEENHVR